MENFTTLQKLKYKNLQVRIGKELESHLGINNDQITDVCNAFSIVPLRCSSFFYYVVCHLFGERRWKCRGFQKAVEGERLQPPGRCS